MGVSTIGGGDGSGIPGGVVDVHPLPLKDNIPIYCNSSDIGAVTEGGAETRKEVSIGLRETLGCGNGSRVRGSYGRFGIWRLDKGLRCRR